jgi:Na+/H+-dicarboxylate symporter
MTSWSKFLKTYFFPVLLILTLILGGAIGYFCPNQTKMIKPLGDMFLNLILTMMVPLIFFSIAKSMANLKMHHQIGHLFKNIVWVYLATGIIASILSVMIIKFFSFGPVLIENHQNPNMLSANLLEKLSMMLTVEKFSDLFSHEHMLALMFFSMLVGIAGTSTISNFLEIGEGIFMKIFSYIMYLAPIGFFAYFANLVANLGPQVISQYAKIATLYYSFAIFYFIFVYSLYGYWVSQWSGVQLFWKNVILPATTALGTCSSMASIPANLKASKDMGIAPAVYETTIPLGTLLHKDGSIIGGIFKIAFLMAAFHLDFTGLGVVVLAIIISLFVGTVMGAIPSGGMMGELLILSVYGFPSNALVSIAAISIIIDPIATMLNTTGNTIATMLIDQRVKN